MLISPDDCTSEGANRVFRFEIIADTQRVMANTVSLLIHVELTFASSYLVILSALSFKEFFVNKNFLSNCAKEVSLKSYLGLPQCSLKEI